MCEEVVFLNNLHFFKKKIFSGNDLKDIYLNNRISASRTVKTELFYAI